MQYSERIEIGVSETTSELAPLRIPASSITRSYRGRQRLRLDPENAERVHLALEAALLEMPPPSMRQIALRLGHAQSRVYRTYPSLCKQVSARYLSARRAPKAQKARQL
jgi:hypothetical protein